VTMRIHLVVVALAACMASSLAGAQRVAPVAPVRGTPHDTVSAASSTLSRASYAGAARAMPAWLKWGLVGAGAGAVTFPLLGSMASDSRNDAAANAVAGAAFGFVIVGGSVALWQAVCGPDSSSRRAGMCGR